jgi:cellulose synthase/poly-beta-1,6-N-acetylglucosamine synthase-like glycosyltransferase
MGVDVSVIMVSDFQAGEEKSWQDMRAALDGLARQDFAGSFEVLLVEEERLVDAIPADLREVLPQLRIVASRATNSYALGNAGVADAAGEIVILLDADCTPVPGWLSSCVAALRANPAAGVVSGHTLSRAHRDRAHHGHAVARLCASPHRRRPHPAHL